MWLIGRKSQELISTDSFHLIIAASPFGLVCFIDELAGKLCPHRSLFKNDNVE